MRKSLAWESRGNELSSPPFMLTSLFPAPRNPSQTNLYDISTEQCKSVESLLDTTKMASLLGCLQSLLFLKYFPRSADVNFLEHCLEKLSCSETCSSLPPPPPITYCRRGNSKTVPRTSCLLFYVHCTVHRAVNRTYWVPRLDYITWHSGLLKLWK